MLSEAVLLYKAPSIDSRLAHRPLQEIEDSSIDNDMDGFTKRPDVGWQSLFSCLSLTDKPLKDTGWYLSRAG